MRSLDPTRDVPAPAQTVTSLLYELPSILERLDYGRLFPKVQPVEVDLGCGDGSFLIEYASRHPDHNFIGVERLLGRIRKVDRRGCRLGLNNLRAVRIEAAYFLRYLLPPASIVALHLYFPDPWPKTKHQRHRLVQPGFENWTARVLAPGGRVYLRTDDDAYFQGMREVFDVAPAFVEVPTPMEMEGLPTDFERMFSAAGTPVHRVSFEKIRFDRA